MVYFNQVVVKVFMLPHVTNAVISRARQEDMSMSPMKLQKLLYFWYMDYKKHNPNDALFSERFEPWEYGPVLSDVYLAFRHYKSRSIRDYFTDPSGRDRMIVVGAIPGLKGSFNRMWCRFSGLDGIQLSKLTHEQSAGSKAYNSGCPVLDDGDIVEDYKMAYNDGKGDGPGA